MDGPRLVVQAQDGVELGLYVIEGCAREDLLLPLHRDPALRRDLRGWPMDHGTFLCSPSDMHCVIRHSCAPTAYVDWAYPGIRAIRALREGEEITINLLTIYEVVPIPFACACGDRDCARDIRGYTALTLAQKLALESHLSPHLRRLLANEVMQARVRAS